MVFSQRGTLYFARGGTAHGKSHENHQAGLTLSAAVCCLLRGKPGPLQSRRGLLFRLYPGTRRSSYPQKQGGPHGPGETHAYNGVQPQSDHATHRSRARYPCYVPTRCYQCRARLAPSSPLSKNGEHVRRNTKPNKRRRARRVRGVRGHRSHLDHGTSQLLSTRASGTNVIPILSCSKSGPARAGPGSKYARSVAISLVASRWAVRNSSAREIAGGCIPLSKRPSRRPPKS